MDLLKQITNETIVITVFIFVMMVIIDYINVITHGKMSSLIKKGGGFKQYIFGALLGLIPACLGLFLVVGFYIRGLVTFGTLFATMFATAGDEGLFMFALFPKKAFLLLSITSVMAIFSGFLIDRLIPILKIKTCKTCELSSIHTEDEHLHYFEIKEVKNNLNNMTLARFLLLLLLVGSILFLIFSKDTEIPLKIILIVVNLMATFVVVTMPEHYLNEHIWDHIAKKHLIKIFLITFFVLSFIELLDKLIDLKDLVIRHQNLISLSAVIIGLIPQSGPHLIFVMMYAKGVLPFEVLLVNTIMQDGHGLLPLLSHSVRDVIYIKLFKLIVVILVLLFYRILMIILT